MGEIPDDDVIIQREFGDDDESSKTKNKSKKKSGTKKTVKHSVKKEAPDNIKKQLKVISILLIFLAVFILLALVSYSPKDELHTEVSISEVGGVFTGDEAVKEKTQNIGNWLGLFGAIISNFLYNGTIGYSILFLPFFMIYWGVDLFRHYNIGSESIKKALAFLLLGTLFAATLGTLGNISWIGGIPKEWNGAVGSLLANSFSTLVSSVGAFLIFFTAMLITIVKLTNIDLDKLADWAVKFVRLSWRKSKSAAIIMKDALTDTAIEINEKKEELSEKRKLKKEQAEKIAEKPETKDNVIPGPKIKEVKPEDVDTEEPARIIKKSVKIKLNNPMAKNSSIRNDFIDEYGKSDSVEGVRRKEGQSTEIPENYSDEQPAAEEYQQEFNEPTKRKESDESNIQKIDANEERPQKVEDFDESEKPELSAEEEDSAPQSAEKEIPEINLTPNMPKNPESIIEQDNSQNIPSAKKPLVVNVKEAHIKKQEEEIVDKIDPINPLSSSIHDEIINYKSPHTDFLIEEDTQTEINEDELKMNAKILQEKLETFKIEIENLTVTPGPVVTQYEFVPAPGIKISKIEGLADDIAMALKARGIRIIAPVPGKGTVGIEIPNRDPSIVRFSSIVKSKVFQEDRFKLPIALGKTISGDVFCLDLAKMPHLLIAGSTGAGKSVGINTIISSLLYKLHPKQLKFVIIDPKKVELAQYGRLDKHFIATSPDINSLIVTDSQDAVVVLKSLCAEMDQRYDILASVGQRNISDYNKKVRKGKFKDDKDILHREMPYIVCVIDELADLMLTASKEVEQPLIRLAQLARAIGIHLVVATQRPSVNVITGIIKANFPARIAYLVASKVDSRTILDVGGADQLLGMGDMLVLPNGTPKPIRVQNAFISTDEVEDICNYIGDQKGYSQPYMLPSLNENDDSDGGIAKEDRDPLFEQAARLIIQHQQGSVSLIQRRLKVGYARAGRIVDELESAGVVGPFDGSKARRVLMESEMELEAVL